MSPECQRHHHVCAGEPQAHALHVAKWGTMQPSARDNHNSSSFSSSSNTQSPNSSTSSTTSLNSSSTDPNNSSNSREDCLHRCSGHFSPDHQPNLRVSEGEATHNCGHSRWTLGSAGPERKTRPIRPNGTNIEPAESSWSWYHGGWVGTDIGHGSAKWADERWQHIAAR